VRLYLIGELPDLPLHIVVETTGELADAFGRVEGYRFVPHSELERLPGGTEALAAWYAGDDRSFREHTIALQAHHDAEESGFDLMTASEREAWLRPRLLEAGHPPAEVERLLQERRREGLRVVPDQDPTGEGGVGQSR
jgi:hypothetical protein